MTEITARLLIVDDDVGFLVGLKATLVGLGYQVDRSSHGADALMAIRLVRPDVVLLDIRMRGLSGVEVLKRIRTMDPTIPVIMVTAADDPVLIRETREIGAYGYLVKPIEESRLTRMVAEAVALSQPGYDGQGRLARPAGKAAEAKG
jgi:DNA-binding NtrC family response regulator